MFFLYNFLLAFRYSAVFCVWKKCNDLMHRCHTLSRYRVGIFRGPRRCTYCTGVGTNVIKCIGKPISAGVLAFFMRFAFALRDSASLRSERPFTLLARFALSRRAAARCACDSRWQYRSLAIVAGPGRDFSKLGTSVFLPSRRSAVN